MVNSKGLSSRDLHIIGMVTMLIDHAYHLLLSDYKILNCIGRISFPIFCFLLVEGFIHTKNVCKYILRIFIFGVISEIPFNLMAGGSLLDIWHQNVLFTMVIGLMCLVMLKISEGYDTLLQVLNDLAAIIVCCSIAEFFKVDYGGAGILTIAFLYILRGNELGYKIMQVSVLLVINILVFDSYMINIFGINMEIQALAVLSLPFIWLYNGEKGKGGKVFKYICYSFYPLHIVILLTLKLLITT